MIEWFTSPYAWVAAFFLLMVLELTTGGIFALMCALGALVTALALWAGFVAEPGYTVLTFLVSTVVLTVVLWKPLQRMMQGISSEPSDKDVEPFLGDLATVVDGPLTAHSGQIRLHGSKMNAILAAEAELSSLDEGAQVIIDHIDSQQRFVVLPVENNA